MGNCIKAAQVDHRNSSNINSTPGTSKYNSTEGGFSGSTGKSRGTSSNNSGTDGRFSGSSAGKSRLSPTLSIDEVNPNGYILPTPNLRTYSFQELKLATKNFKIDTVLGEGGFGKVYKGLIEERSNSRSGSGLVVAVKKLNSESLQGFEEWQSEVDFLGRLSHPNLVKLLGYCWEDRELLLVYEFLAKGSLENHLFKKGGQPLSWSVRLKIAIGAARGLAFLHSSEKQIIYRDFKASNILLDANYNAKLSDFGLAKNGPMGGASHVTTRVMGTHGYAAPEYVATGHLYVKSDVYGFGVVLLEMLSGQRALDINRPSGQHKLVEWLKPSLSDRRRLKSIMDPRLENEYPTKAASQAAQLTLKCLGEEPKVRPSMKEVVEKLERIQAMERTSKESRTTSSHTARDRHSQNRRSPIHPRQENTGTYAYQRSPRVR